MAETDARPYPRTRRRRNVEQHFGQRFGKSTGNKPLRIDPQDGFVDAEAGHGDRFKARGLGA